MPKNVPENDEYANYDLDQLEKEYESLKEKLKESKIRRNFVQQERVIIHHLGNDSFVL